MLPLSALMVKAAVSNVSSSCATNSPQSTWCNSKRRLTGAVMVEYLIPD